MKLLVLLPCFVAVCVASKALMPPKFPETFCASGEIEYHLADKTLFGKFFIGRDETNQKGIEMAYYPEEKDSVIALLRYDLKPDPYEYYIHSKMGAEHCIPDKRNGTASHMPPFWSWVSVANYEGERSMRHGDTDFWGYSVGDVRFELGVSKLNPTQPAYYNRKEAEDFVQYSFISFNDTAPPSSELDVPKACEDV